MRLFVFGTRGFPNIQGGVEKHCENLYPLIAKNFPLTVFRRKAYIDKRNDWTYPNIRFIDFISTKIKGFESFFHSFLCALYCFIHPPHIVHIHNIGPGIFVPLLKLIGIKIVLTYHSPNYEHKKWGAFAKFILKTGERFSLKGADAIIFVNKYQMGLYPAKIQRKSYFIPNGIKQHSRSLETDFIERLDLDKQKYILAVGRITQEKGFDYLIEAYASSTFKNSYKLVIAGGIDHNSPYAKTLIQKAKKTQVVLAGYTDGENLRQLYSHAKLFILPSYNEGYPLTLLEAINYHLPILASDIPGNRQLELPDNIYFPVADKEALINKIKAVLDSNDTVYNYQQHLYTWNEIANETISIYKKIDSISK